MLIVDDCRIYRDGLAALVAESDNVARVLTAETSEDALACLVDLRPDLLLLNLAMAKAQDCLREVRAIDQVVGVIVIGVSEDDSQIVACAELGVSGYVLRSDSLAHLCRLMEAVLAGQTLCSPRVSAALLRRVATMARERDEAQVPVLTPREVQISRLLEEGLSNKEIALRLSIEIRTVKNHVHHILEKLGVQRRGEAVAVLRAPYRQRGKSLA